MQFPRLIFAGLVLSLAVEAAPFKKVLTDATKGYRVASWQMVSSDLAGYRGEAKWHIRKRILQGGKQEGVEIIEVDNGKLRFRVIPTRGMGILDVNLGDVRLGWDSPIKEVVHPKFINLESRGGLGWIEGFNEWMARCGLEYAGHPGKDEFITNTGDKGQMDLTLHGKISNIPASEVMVTVDRQASQPFLDGGYAPGARSLIVTNTRLDVTEAANDAVVRMPSTTVADLALALSRCPLVSARVHPARSVLDCSSPAGALLCFWYSAHVLGAFLRVHVNNFFI